MNNGYKTFEHVSEEVNNKFYDKYLSYKNNYNPAPLPSENASQGNNSTIDDFLNNESDALIDKIKTNAKAILSRLSINDYISYSLDYTSLKLRNELLDFQRSFPYDQAPFDSTKTSLLSEMNAVEKQRLDEKVKCWQDILNPMTYFVDLYHKHKSLKQDKKLLEDK